MEIRYACRLGPMCIEFRGVKMLTPFGGLCCAGFINPIGVAAGVRRLNLSIGPI
jgi:hypothetical protein